MIVAWLVVLLALVALSLQSLWVLRARSPWTSAGWWLTVLYSIIAGARATTGTAALPHVEYVALIALTAAFVVAGRRDEPQAEPWWWPSGIGKTGSERASAPRER